MYIYTQVNTNSTTCIYIPRLTHTVPVYVHVYTQGNTKIPSKYMYIPSLQLYVVCLSHKCVGTFVP